MGASKFYAHSAFTSLGGSRVNYALLDAQIAALTLTEYPNASIPQNLGALITWDNFPDPTPVTGDIAKIDAVVAAHAGTVTTDQLQQFQSLEDTSTTSTSYIAKQTSGVDVEFVSSPLVAGPYLICVGAQIRMNVTAANTGVACIIRAGVGSSLSGSDDKIYTEGTFMSSTLNQLWVPKADVVIVTEGQRIRLQPRLKRLGASGTAIMNNFYYDLCRIPTS